MEFYLEKGNIASVQTKRGCSQACVYCSYPVLEGSAVRCREPKAVVDEIQILMEKHNAGHVFFTDSVFNDDEGHYLEVVREMKRRGVTIPWTAFFRPEGLDDEARRADEGDGAEHRRKSGPTQPPTRRFGGSGSRFGSRISSNATTCSAGTASRRPTSTCSGLPERPGRRCSRG